MTKRSYEDTLADLKTIASGRISDELLDQMATIKEAELQVAAEELSKRGTTNIPAIGIARSLSIVRELQGRRMGD